MHSLKKNSILNLLGAVLPALVAIPSLGYLARALTLESFGVLMLIFALIGYAGIFDFGLGKAVIRETAVNRDDGGLVHGEIIGTVTAFIFLMGSTVSLLLLCFSVDVSRYLFGVTDANVEATAVAIQYASLCVPILLITVALQSYLEGRELFIVVNIFKSFSGVLIYALPVLFYVLTSEFKFLILGLLVARLIILIAIVFVINNYCPIFRWSYSLSRLLTMVKFGGWLTVTNIISPIMVYMDRFFIAKVLSPGVVALYSAPAELITKLAILPGSISRALFPNLARGGKAERQSSMRYTYKLMASVNVPVAILTFILAPVIIKYWFGEPYIETSTPILRIMIIGFLVNAFALIPYSSLQAKGYSYTTAKIHLIELTPYLLALYLVIPQYGVIGVTVVWTLRMFVDFLAMYYCDWLREKECGY